MTSDRNIKAIEQKMEGLQRYIQQNEEKLKQLREQRDKLPSSSRKYDASDAIRAFDDQIAALEGKQLALRRDQDACVGQISALQVRRNQLQIFDGLINRVYDNPARILENSDDAIHEITARVKTHDVKSAVIAHMGEGTQKVNKITPTMMEGAWEKGTSAAKSSTAKLGDYQPMTTTSIPSQRHYDHTRSSETQSSDMQELRFGTQSEYVGATARANPLFDAWLDVRARNGKRHLYINNLGKDREWDGVSGEASKVAKGTKEAWQKSKSVWGGLKNIGSQVVSNLNEVKDDYEGSTESALSERLHELEAYHDNVIVISLPADKGLMDKEELSNTSSAHTYNEVKKLFIKLAKGQQVEGQINDFHISTKAKQLLFGALESGYDERKEHTELERLVDLSLAKLGFKPGDMLSGADRQAVLFHFTKYELTNFALEKLEPDTFNMACKDAIDRGGVSSLYYNLLKSIEKGTPMTEQEFHRGLHAAPTMVKGRGMNHHTKVIWNAVDRFAANANNNVPKWLDEWRLNNAPKGRKPTPVMSVSRKELDSAAKGALSTTVKAKIALNVVKTPLEEEVNNFIYLKQVLSAEHFAQEPIAKLLNQIVSSWELDSTEAVASCINELKTFACEQEIDTANADLRNIMEVLRQDTTTTFPQIMDKVQEKLHITDAELIAADTLRHQNQ